MLPNLQLERAKNQVHMEEMQLHTKSINMLTEKSNLEV